MLFIVVIMVVVVAWLIGAMIRRPGQMTYRSTVGNRDRPVQKTMSDAQRILEERFARGEIDADEFTRRRTLLRGDS